MKDIIVLFLLASMCFIIAFVPKDSGHFPSLTERRFVASLGVNEWEPEPWAWKKYGHMLAELGYTQAKNDY